MTWDLNQERAFIEKLLNQRFNFFLVFFSIVLAAALSAKTQFYLTAVLFIGLVICALLGAAILRAQKKLDIILENLFSDPANPIAMVNDKAGRRYSARKAIGYVIPIFCTGILFIAFFLSLAGILKPQ